MLQSAFLQQPMRCADSQQPMHGISDVYKRQVLGRCYLLSRLRQEIFWRGEFVCQTVVQAVPHAKKEKNVWNSIPPVSYTHLDVYKRQLYDRPFYAQRCHWQLWNCRYLWQTMHVILPEWIKVCGKWRALLWPCLLYTSKVVRLSRKKMMRSRQRRQVIWKYIL